MTSLIDSGRASPVLNGGIEYGVISISLDSSGNGSGNFTYEEEFRNSDVTVSITGSDAGDYTVNSAGQKEATVGVSGGPADTTVDAHVIVLGSR